MFLLKEIWFHTGYAANENSWQTIDERGSEIPTTSVFDCQLSPGGRLMAINNYVSNYFWSTFVDNFDIFDCRLSGVYWLYASWCYGGHFCIIKLIGTACAWKEGIQQWRYNILFRILTFAKPSYINVLQPSPLRGWGCNTLSHSGLANVNIRKRMFYPLIKARSHFNKSVIQGNVYFQTIHMNY